MALCVIAKANAGENQRVGPRTHGGVGELFNILVAVKQFPPRRGRPLLRIPHSQVYFFLFLVFG